MSWRISWLLIAATLVAAGCAKGDPQAAPAAPRAVPSPAVASEEEPAPQAPSPDPDESPSQAEVADPIDALVADLGDTHGRWNHGLSPDLRLPETATIDEVLTRMFTWISFDEGRVTEHRIVEQREVRIDEHSAPLTAVRVATNLGDKVVLLRYEAMGWWTRAY